MGAEVRTPGSERSAWIVAGTLSALLVGLIVYNVVTQEPAPQIPDMANAGAAAGDQSGAPVGAPPDISQLSPRERFDRLSVPRLAVVDFGNRARRSLGRPRARPGRRRGPTSSREHDEAEEDARSGHLARR